MANALSRLIAAIPRTDTPPSALVQKNGNGSHLEQKAVIYPRHLFWLPGQDADSSIITEVQGRRAYMAAALAYICIKYRATKVREAPLMVVKETEDGESWLKDHELAPLLARPNPDYGTRRLVETTEIYLCTTGRCAWLKNRDRSRRVASLYPFSGDVIEVERGTKRLYGRFKVDGNWLSPDDVVYFSYVNPNDPLGGAAPLDAALATLNIGQQLQSRIKSHVKNAMAPGAIYVADKEWRADQAEFDRLKQELSTMFQEANSGSTAIAEGGGKIERGWSLEDLALGELWREVEATVCGVFGVPASLVGTIVGLENSPWSHMETAKRAFYDETVLPEWEFLEEVITDSLLRKVDDDVNRLIRFDTSRIRALQKDLQVQATIVGTVRKELSLNERRGLLGLKPSPDPKADDIPELTEPEFEPFQANPFGREGKAQNLHLAAANDALDQSEGLWAMVVSGLLDRDRAALTEILRQEGKQRNWLGRMLDEIDHWLEDAKTYWLISVSPLVRLTGEAALRNLLLAGAPSPGTLPAERMTRFVDRTATFLIKNVSDTTREAVKEALREGFANGEPPERIAKRIADLSEFSRDRARLIARTETIRAYNGAQFDAIKLQEERYGIRFSKRWVATLDNRVRDSHKATHGESQSLEAKFSNGCAFPGDPEAPASETCNCRCVLTYGVVQ